MIKLMNINKRIETNVLINNLSLNIEEGKIIGFFGESAIGKTTLLNIIAGLDNDYEGNVIGCDKVSYSFQDDRLLEWYDVYKNLKLTIKKGENIDEWLSKFDVLNLKNKNSRFLSGGEKRKISLIRALSNDSNIILLDEPFNGIDENNKNKVIDFIKNFNHKNHKTIILISHEIEDEYRLCDEIYFFKKGMVIDKVLKDIKKKNN